METPGAKESGQWQRRLRRGWPLLPGLFFLLGALPAEAASSLGDDAFRFAEEGVVSEPLSDQDDPWDDPWFDDDPWSDDTRKSKTLADPLEPLNRVFFKVNDRLYFLVLKPVATVYANTFPEEIRVCFRSFYRNLTAPVRVVNHLLQGQFKNSGTEVVRFAVNTTIGIGGLVDSASRNFGIEARDADFGQTLGVYGIGDGLYIHWPLVGPSTLRDTVGLTGDAYLNPFSYLATADYEVGAALYSGVAINSTSLKLGEYERLVEASFDPYLAVRDAYWQYRRNQIRERKPAWIKRSGPPDPGEEAFGEEEQNDY